MCKCGTCRDRMDGRGHQVAAWCTEVLSSLKEAQAYDAEEGGSACGCYSHTVLRNVHAVLWIAIRICNHTEITLSRLHAR